VRMHQLYISICQCARVTSHAAEHPNIARMHSVAIVSIATYTLDKLPQSELTLISDSIVVFWTLMDI